MVAASITWLPSQQEIWEILRNHKEHMVAVDIFIKKKEEKVTFDP